MSTKKVSPQNIKGTDFSNQKNFLLNKKKVKNFLVDSSHHAYCFVTQNPSEGGFIIKEAVESVWQIPYQGNPDFLHYQKGSLSIDDAHFLREWSSVNSAKKSEKICLLETYSITSESQNALLKLFESAPSHTRFLIVINSKEILLPTLSSRLVIFMLETTTDSDINIDKFLTGNIADRERMFKSILSDKDTAQTQKFLDVLEKRLYEIESLNKNFIQYSSFLKSIPFIKKTNMNQRSSLKTILDYLIYFTPNIEKDRLTNTK